MFLLHRLVFVLNSLAILGLLGSYLALYISPAFSWPIAFAGLAFPVLVLVNILFILYWCIFLKMKFLFSLATLVIGWGYINNFFQWQGQIKETFKKPLKVLTFNAKYMGHDVQNASTDDFFTYLSEKDPDVICLQEFHTNVDDQENSLDRLKNTYGYKYHHFIITNDPKYKNLIGYLIASKYPIVKKGEVTYSQTSWNHTTFADIKVGEDTLRVFNVHLQSINFQEEDYQFFKSMPIDKDSNLVYTKGIVRKLKYAFVKRSSQALEVSSFVKESPHKVVVCGDFNDTPVSYAYRTMCSGLKDAFIESGHGIGNTYVGPFPSFRIDYILTDAHFDCFNYESKEMPFSDHKLVYSVIERNP